MSVISRTLLYRGSLNQGSSVVRADTKPLDRGLIQFSTNLKLVKISILFTENQKKPCYETKKNMRLIIFCIVIIILFSPFVSVLNQENPSISTRGQKSLGTVLRLQTNQLILNITFTLCLENIIS